MHSTRLLAALLLVLASGPGCSGGSSHGSLSPLPPGETASAAADAPAGVSQSSAPAPTESAPAAAPAAAPASAPTGGGPSAAASAGPRFRGDGQQLLAWGGWAYGNDPADAIAAAGFDWFETGYPGDTATNQTLAAANVRPFAYINLGELDPTLASQANYTGPFLGTNSDWGNHLVDVTDPSWQAWLVSRAEYAYRTGSRGVKWDVATPDVPPGKTRDDVNAAIAAVMTKIRAAHPDMKFVYNQGASFVLAYPGLADGLENEGLFSASSYPSAWLQPWLDPYYWGPAFADAQAILKLGKIVVNAEYFDPWSTQAQQLYAAMVAQGVIPYITNSTWNIRGWGYGVNPGW